MKKVTAVLMALIMMLTSTACGGTTKDVDTKFATQYALKGVVQYNEPTEEYSFTDEIGSEQNFIEFKEETKEMITVLQEDLFSFFTQECKLDWEYKFTEVKVLDFSQVNQEYKHYAAMADPAKGVVYVNIIIQDEMELIYHLVHEIVHCLRYYNEKNVKFIKTNEDGSYIGYYVGEAFTDLVAIRFLESCGFENATEYFLTSSAYSYILASLMILECSIENMMIMYLKDDMESFHMALKELGEAHIVDGEKFDYGEIFFIRQT